MFKLQVFIARKLPRTPHLAPRTSHLGTQNSKLETRTINYSPIPSSNIPLFYCWGYWQPLEVFRSK